MLDSTAAQLPPVLRRYVYCTDVDVMEQALGSLLTSKGCKDLIEHIIQCMYSLYGPSQAPVTVVGYGFTDLRIYPPPSPSRRPTRGRGSPNQNVAGYVQY